MSWLITSNLLAYWWAVAGAAIFSVGIDHDQTISNVRIDLQEVDITIGESEKSGLLKICGKSSAVSHTVVLY